MTIYDAITGEKLGFVRMANSPYWLTAYEAWDAAGVMYSQFTRIATRTFQESKHELMAWLLEDEEGK